MECRLSFDAKATVDGGLELQSVHRAADGTCKLLFKLKVSLSAWHSLIHKGCYVTPLMMNIGIWTTHATA